MKIYVEKSLSEFEFWSYGLENARYLTEQEFDIVENILEETYPNGVNETELNDMFWFHKDIIAEWLGYESFEDLKQGRESKYNPLFKYYF